MLHINHMS